MGKRYTKRVRSKKSKIRIRKGKRKSKTRKTQKGGWGGIQLYKPVKRQMYGGWGEYLANN